MRRKPNQQAEFIPVANGVGTAIHNTILPAQLPAEFDDTVALLLAQMDEPESASHRQQMTEHHILAALLLHGAYPVVH